MFFTYILKLSNGKCYTGLSGNIFQRLLEHEKGKSISTRRHRPVKIIALYKVGTRLEARRLEVAIKNRGAMRFINSYGCIDK